MAWRSTTRPLALPATGRALRARVSAPGGYAAARRASNRCRCTHDRAEMLLRTCVHVALEPTIRPDDLLPEWRQRGSTATTPAHGREHEGFAERLVEVI